MGDAIVSALIVAPPILALVAAAFAWRKITHPILFFAVSLFLLPGIQQLLAPAAIAVFLPTTEDLSPVTVNDAFVRSVILNSFVQLVVGGGLMWWLFRALRKP